MYIVKGVYMSLSTSLQLGGKSPISGSPIYTLRNSPGHPPLKKKSGDDWAQYGSKFKTSNMHVSCVLFCNHQRTPLKHMKVSWDDCPQ